MISERHSGGNLATALFTFDDYWAGNGRPEDAPTQDDGITWIPPEVLTAAQLCALPPPIGTPLLGREHSALIMPGWRVIIGAPTGAGKTTLALHMIRAITQEKELLGYRGAGGRALVLDLEQGLRTVQRRLGEVGLSGSDEVDYVRIPDGLALERSPAQREWLGELLVKGGYAIVLIDPLYKMHQGDPNDERAIVDLLRSIDRLRDELGFAVLIPAHMRKRQANSGPVGMDDIAGSAGLVRGAEIVFGLQLLQGLPESNPAGFGRSRLWFWKDRDGDLSVGAKWDLTFRPDEGFKRDEQVRYATKDKVRVMLAEVSPAAMSCREIAERLELAERTIERAINELREDGVELVEGGSAGPRKRKTYALRHVIEDEDLEGWTFDA